MTVKSQSTALRVVIVDDSSHFLVAARNVLRQEGADVVGTASTIEQALQVAAELRPDVILVDVDLGDESGFDLAERLKAADAASVVLISAYPEAELLDLIAASPALGFVAKSNLSAQAVSDLLGREDG
jgi:DNA-binding NarL/FixJ family response regulator